LSEILDRKESALLSFEAEVESLNFKIEALSKDVAERRKMEDTGRDPLKILQEALEEKKKVEDQLQRTKQELSQSNLIIERLQASERAAKEAVLVERENLALATASSTNLSNNDEAQETVKKLQAVWEALGVESSLREQVCLAIERSLEETCRRELAKAQDMKRSCDTKISTLDLKLTAMQRAMGMSTLPHHRSNSRPLLVDLEKLQNDVGALETPYRFSVVRREKILKELKQLLPVLGVSETEIDANLKTLLEGERSFQSIDTEDGLCSPSDQDVGQDSFIALPPNCLEPTFLSSCENGVRKLRVQKSVALVRNRELQQELSDLIDKMHLSPKEALELVHNLKQGDQKSMRWWNENFVEEVLRSISMKRFVSDPSESVSNHLELLRELFTRAASSRRSVSSALKNVIENAQKTLLDIVGREFDASEAYAGFHDALFRLPALSKDLILSCISEMEALIDGIDSMTQSEIEALTVIWEALNIPASDRRNFWGQMEKTDPKKLSSQKSLIPHDAMKLVMASEEWIGKSAKRASEVFSHLDQKLEKLGRIHREVERLRSKQDLKSKILSLDSEIRIMNSKLLDFEEHCNKQRLLTKKTGAGALLKEERFRKQMQSRFITNLRQLASLLQSWETQERAPFDSTLLSEDVRMMLKNSDHMDSWVEERTKFMGLRTVKSQTPNKRPYSTVGSQDGNYANPKRHASGLTPPRKRQARPRLMDESVPGKKRPPTALKPSRGKESDKQGLRERDDNRKDSGKEKKVRTKHHGSLRPFENILSDLASPSRDN
jgi:hypothetical protein